jgi:hypothetical protein
VLREKKQRRNEAKRRGKMKRTHDIQFEEHVVERTLEFSIGSKYQDVVNLVLMQAMS